MRRAVIAASAVLLFVFPSAKAFGCRCEALGDPPDIEKSLARADLVFFGNVVSSFGDDDSYADSRRGWDFDVAAVWKGEVGRNARVYAHSENGSISSCDQEFEVGRAYVVFGFLEADVSYPRFRVNRCSLTTRVELGEPYAQEIVGRLGEPKRRPSR